MGQWPRVFGYGTCYQCLASLQCHTNDFAGAPVFQGLRSVPFRWLSLKDSTTCSHEFRGHPPIDIPSKQFSTFSSPISLRIPYTIQLPLHSTHSTLNPPPPQPARTHHTQPAPAPRPAPLRCAAAVRSAPFFISVSSAKARESRSSCVTCSASASFSA